MLVYFSNAHWSQNKGEQLWARLKQGARPSVQVFLVDVRDSMLELTLRPHGVCIGWNLASLQPGHPDTGDKCAKKCLHWL